MKRTLWFERNFPTIEDNGRLPTIIERLSGTPARLKEITHNLDELILKEGGKWSIKDEAGHLGDLEQLWIDRVDDLINQSPELRPADLSNQKTNKANHNSTDLPIIIQSFHTQRNEFVAILRNVTDEQLLHISLHPRLKTPMRIIDLAYFVAEHDDHHLVRIREILDNQKKSLQA